MKNFKPRLIRFRAYPNLTYFTEGAYFLYFLEKNFKEKKQKVEKFNTDVGRVYSIDYMNSKDMIVSASVRGFSDLYVYNTSTTNLRQLSNDPWDDLDAVGVNIGGRKGILFSLADGWKLRFGSF